MTTPEDLLAGSEARPGGDAGNLAIQLGQLARALEREPDAQATLEAIVVAAAGTIPGAEEAGITTVVDRRTVCTVAATGELVAAVDQGQYDTGQGPCLDSLYRDRMVFSPDVARDPRWPEFGPRAAALGVGSMLSFQLFVRGDTLGALNLYARTTGAFGEESQHVGSLFATHAAVSLAAAERQDQLEQALSSRDLIGQAKGILMERYGLNGDQAFALLVRVSQNGNRKLRDIAEQLARTKHFDPSA